MEVVYARNNATMYQTLIRIGKDKNLTLYNQEELSSNVMMINSTKIYFDSEYCAEAKK